MKHLIFNPFSCVLFSLFLVSCSREPITFNSDQFEVNASNRNSNLKQIELSSEMNKCYDFENNFYEGSCDILNMRYEKLIKVTNEGRGLPDNAALGNGPNDWACTMAIYRDLNENLQYVLWEVKTSDDGFRDMKWNYSKSTNDSSHPGVEMRGKCKRPNGQVASDCSTSQYISDVNTRGLCGFNQWSLPDLNELTSLLKCPNNRSNRSVANPNEPTWFGGFECSKPISGVVNIDNKFFPNTEYATYNAYWTIDQYPVIKSEFWFVNFSTGAKLRIGVSNPFGVRLVHRLSREQASSIANNVVTPPVLEELKIYTNSDTDVVWGEELRFIANTSNPELKWWYIDPTQSYHQLACLAGLAVDTCTFKVPEQIPVGNYKMFAELNNNKVLSNKITIRISAAAPAPQPVPQPAPRPMPLPVEAPVPIAPQKLTISQLNNQIIIASPNDKIEKLVWKGQYPVPMLGLRDCYIKPKDIRSISVAEIEENCTSVTAVTVQVSGVLKGQTNLILSNKLTVKRTSAPAPVPVPVPAPVAAPVPAPVTQPLPPPSPAPQPGPAGPQKLTISQVNNQIIVAGPNDKVEKLEWKGQYPVPMIGLRDCYIRPKDIHAVSIAEIKENCTSVTPVTLQVSGVLKIQNSVILSNKLTVN